MQTASSDIKWVKHLLLLLYLAVLIFIFTPDIVLLKVAQGKSCRFRLISVRCHHCIFCHDSDFFFPFINKPVRCNRYGIFPACQNPFEYAEPL